MLGSKSIVALCLFLGIIGTAHAQSAAGFLVVSSCTSVPSSQLPYVIGSVHPGTMDPYGNICNFDSPFMGSIAMTDGTVYTAQRSIGFNCTVAGNVIVTFWDGSTTQVPLGVGWQTFPFAAVKWTASGVSGSAATATAVNLR